MNNYFTKFIIYIFSLNLLRLIHTKTIPSSNWFLEIKDSKGSSEQITLKAGQVQRITFILHHENDIGNSTFLDTSFDESNFTISIDDEDGVKIYPNNEFNIVPSKSLEYSTYVGLKCDHKIKNELYELKPYVKNIKDLNNNIITNATLEIKPITVKIDNEPTLLELEPIEINLTEKGKSLFRLKNEIFNMKKVEIMVNKEEKDKYVFNDIQIEDLDERYEIGEDENYNHGILFKYPFGTEYTISDLNGEINKTFNLIIKESSNSKCFKLSEESHTLNISINGKEAMVLNDSIKEAILYSIEDITSKNDISNNIKIKLNIPISPVIVKCFLNGYGEENDEIEYNNYITEPGEYILKFNDLNTNNEYKLKCKFSPTNFLKNEIEIVVGNFENSDLNIPLIPSRTPNQTPQCIEFNFDSGENINIFTSSAEKICQKKMNENENILSRIMGVYKCEKATIPFEEIKNRSIICIGESLDSKSKKYREYHSIEKNTYYEEHINKFMGILDTTEKIKNVFIEKEINLKLVNIKRYYDSNPPDITKIKLINNNVLEKENDIYKKKNDLSFKIISTNENPIECFYNKELKPTDKKKFMKLYYKENTGIILNPKEEKTIDVNITNIGDKKMYSLYMNCYNLPGASIRYEKTGVYNAYTYLYDDIDDEQKVIEAEKITINCAEKNNKINPHCLKHKYNYLYKILRTKITINDIDTDNIDIESDVEKFNKLSNRAQLLFLKNIIDSFDVDIESMKNNKKNLLKKIYYITKYLTNRVCSQYSKGSTNKLSETIDNNIYKSCRENKKLLYKKIMNIIKAEFKCNDFKKLISKEGLSLNVEDNLKNLIILLQELTNNADSINKGESDILYDMVFYLQNNFDDYWTEVKLYLKEKKSLDITISAIKKDLTNLLMYTLSNLVKVIHFEEIDNYISEKDRNIKKTGIMAHDKGKKIYKSIKNFMKYFNEFGTREYNLTDSIIINIYTNNNIDTNEKIIDIEDKGIIIIFNPKSMLEKNNAYAMHVIIYDSPIMPVKTTGKKKR